VRVRLLGIGMGPQHLTRQVCDALRDCDYVIAARKHDDDELLRIRSAIAAEFGLEVIEVADPERDRQSPADYPGAVRSWHRQRVAAYHEVLRERGGTAAFLVWGDPALYDSTIRVMEQLAELQTIEYDVLPGISAPQLLAARHRLVLHEIGQPVHVTTARRLAEAVSAGQENIVVMLGGIPDLSGFEDWQIWWGANLDAPSESLLSGRVSEVLPRLLELREQAKERAGWVMDTYLLRKEH
jgi:precorrin-6A synthase